MLYNFSKLLLNFVRLICHLRQYIIIIVLVNYLIWQQTLILLTHIIVFPPGIIFFLAQVLI